MLKKIKIKRHLKKNTSLGYFSQAVVTTLVLTTVFIFSGCSKKETTLTVGGQNILVPIPTGFHPVSKVASHFMEFMRAGAPPNFVVIEYYLNSADLRDVLAGHSKSRSQTLSLRTTRNMLFQNYSEEAFLEDASEIRAGAAIEAAAANGGKRQAGASEPGNSMSGVPKNGTPLGVFFERKDAIGTLMLQKFSTPSGEVRRLDLSFTARIKNRYILLLCTSDIKSEADSNSIKRICSNWVGSILESNPD